MLTGFISATVTDGVLDISGAGDLQIHQLPQTYNGEWPGVKLELIGKNNGNQATTLINGEPSVILTGIKSGVNIDARGIALRVGNVQGSGGSPTLPRAEVSLPGNVTIDAYNARLYLENHTQVTVNGTFAGDEILISGSKLFNLTINADTDPLGQVGNDLVRLVAIQANGTVDIDMGGSLRASGRDELYINSKFGSVFNGPLNITTAGTTFVSMGSGGGAYPLLLNGPFNYNGGDKGDFIDIDGIQIVGSFTAILNGDTDNIIFKNARASAVTLDGGSGNDGLVHNENTDLGAEIAINFELIL